jgi:catechol-2,3-dioxygenase
MSGNQTTYRSGLVIFAKNLQRVADFYVKTLALQVVEQDESYIVLHAEGIEIVVLQIRPEISAGITISDPPEVREGTPFKPAFIVDSFSDIREIIVEAGGTLRPMQAAWQFQNTLVLDGTDPEGNVVQFRQLIANNE